MKRALIIIDLQNDYFEGGKFPLWNTSAVLENIKVAIKKANENSVPIIFVEHIVPKESGGLAPFFNEGTEGAKIRQDLLELAPNAKVVTKTYADGFYETNLEEVLSSLGVEKLIICGMMTQNCVTHTAISKSADKYKVSILPECTTTVDEMIHNIALHAVSTRIQFETIESAF